MITHKFVGEGQACELLLEEPGRMTEHCARPVTHPIHAGVCVHCKYSLDLLNGDGSDVCRFCHPHYAEAPEGRRCVYCFERRWHE